MSAEGAGREGGRAKTRLSVGVEDWEEVSATAAVGGELCGSEGPAGRQRQGRGEGERRWSKQGMSV